MTIVRLFARPMLAAIFVVQGLKAVKNPAPLVPIAELLTDRLVPTVKGAVPGPIADRIPDDTATLIRINGAVQVAAGIALATGRAPRASAAVLAASLLSTTVAGHAFWRSDDPDDRAEHRRQFLKNVGLCGGLLLAAVDTAGHPGLWWRTRHGAQDARRASGRALRDAKRRASDKVESTAKSVSSHTPFTS